MKLITARTERRLCAQVLSIKASVDRIVAQRDDLKRTNATLLDLTIRQARELDALREGKPWTA